MENSLCERQMEVNRVRSEIVVSSASPAIKKMVFTSHYFLPPQHSSSSYMKLFIQLSPSYTHHGKETTLRSKLARPHLHLHHPSKQTTRHNASSHQRHVVGLVAVHAQQHTGTSLATPALSVSLPRVRSQRREGLRALRPLNALSTTWRHAHIQRNTHTHFFLNNRPPARLDVVRARLFVCVCVGATRTRHTSIPSRLTTATQHKRDNRKRLQVAAVFQVHATHRVDSNTTQTQQQKQQLQITITQPFFNTRATAASRRPFFNRRSPTR
jgi:hypothetical protein